MDTYGLSLTSQPALKAFLFDPDRIVNITREADASSNDKIDSDIYKMLHSVPKLPMAANM